jgi:hypothetical protein
LSEYNEQVKIFNWAKQNEPLIPELFLLNASLNGVRLNIGQAVKAKAVGMKAGYPDICLPVARNGYHGLYIELKIKGGKEQAIQKIWKTKLEEQQYFSTVCIGADEAINTIKFYLGVK